VRWVKRLLPVLLVAALGLGAWEWFTHSFHVSVGYCVEARFETAPANDRELRKWLESQPRMVPGKVLIGREGPDKQVLRVMFIRTPNLARDPPFPDLAGACRTLGYSGAEFTFRDSVDGSISNLTSE
jgi:hypothetical protein